MPLTKPYQAYLDRLYRESEAHEYGLLKPGFWRLCHAVGPSFTPTHWQPATEPKE